MSGARGSRRYFPEAPRKDRERGRARPVVDEPIVEELFSVERLEEHAADSCRRPNCRARLEPWSADPASRRRERSRLGGVIPSVGAGDRGGACDHAGGRVARRQLHDRRRTSSRDPRRLAGGLLPRAPQGGRGPFGGLPTRPGFGVGLCRPHRQPLRSRDAAANGAGVSTGRAVDDRGAVGDCDQPAHPARREPPPPRRADRARPGGAPVRR